MLCDVYSSWLKKSYIRLTFFDKRISANIKLHKSSSITHCAMKYGNAILRCESTYLSTNFCYVIFFAVMAYCDLINECILQ